LNLKHFIEPCSALSSIFFLKNIFSYEKAVGGRNGAE